MIMITSSLRLLSLLQSTSTITAASMSCQFAEALVLDAITHVGLAAAAEDQVEEMESLLSAIEIDNEEQNGNHYYLPQPSKSEKKSKEMHGVMLDSLKKASADVIVVGTQNEYRK